MSTPASRRRISVPSRPSLSDESSSDEDSAASGVSAQRSLGKRATAAFVHPQHNSSSSSSSDESGSSEDEVDQAHRPLAPRGGAALARTHTTGVGARARSTALKARMWANSSDEEMIAKRTMRVWEMRSGAGAGLGSDPFADSTSVDADLAQPSSGGGRGGACKWIIVVIVVLVLAGAAVGGYFLYQNYESNSSLASSTALANATLPASTAQDVASASASSALSSSATFASGVISDSAFSMAASAGAGSGLGALASITASAPFGPNSATANDKSSKDAFAAANTAFGLPDSASVGLNGASHSITLAPGSGGERKSESDSKDVVGTATLSNNEGERAGGSFTAAATAKATDNETHDASNKISGALSSFAQASKDGSSFNSDVQIHTAANGDVSINVGPTTLSPIETGDVAGGKATHGKGLEASMTASASASSTGAQETGSLTPGGPEKPVVLPAVAKRQ